MTKCEGCGEYRECWYWYSMLLCDECKLDWKMLEGEENEAKQAN
jgi:hypothetical protein